MKENIYTIPVLDAFNTNSECPFCTMSHTLEIDAINFTLGPSYMEVDVRGKTNELGFCSNHIEKLYKEKNRLGLALMLQSHMNVLQKQLKNIIASDSNSKRATMFGKKNSQNNKVFSYIKEKESSCYICNTVNNTFDRYVDTFFYLFKHDTDFVKTVENSKGFCINHFGILYQLAPKHFNNKSLDRFYDTLIQVQFDNLQRVNNDLDWFIKKFDFRFANEPWGNAKDAVLRVMNKINSVN